MAIKKPLVNDNGVIKELSSGDSISPQIIASDGLKISPNLTPNHIYTYDSSGSLLTDTYTDVNANTYRQTFTWTNGLLTSTSNWIKQ